jgi:hypothetical protein
MLDLLSCLNGERPRQVVSRTKTRPKPQPRGKDNEMAQAIDYLTTPVRRSSLYALATAPKHPPGLAMTLGNMREMT